MKKAVVNILPFFCFLGGCLHGVSAEQIAYVSSSQGIYEFIVDTHGGLKTLQSRPVESSPISPRLYINPATRTLYAIDQSSDSSIRGSADKIYSYAIGKSGKLSLRNVTSGAYHFVVQSGAVDVRSQLLYLLVANFSTEKNEVIVYDISRPGYLVKRQKILPWKGAEAIEANGIVPAQEVASAILFGGGGNSAKLRLSGGLQRYRVKLQNPAPLSYLAHSQVSSGIIVGVSAGRNLVFGSAANQLSVFKIESKAGLVFCSTTKIPETATGTYPWGFAYCAVGRFLYVGLYNAEGDARNGTQPSTILAYHLTPDNQLLLINTATLPPVSDPLPVMGQSGKYLYVVSQMDSRIDTYKVGNDGKLSRAAPPIKLTQPTGIVFFNNTL